MKHRFGSCIAALVVGWVTFADASAQIPGVIMSYSLPSPSTTVGEPIVLNIELRNDSDSQVTIDLGRNKKQHFAFHVTFPDATTARQLSLPPKEGISRFGLIQVPPRRQYADTLLLNEWFDVSQTGIYEVTVTLSAPIESSAGARSSVSPFQFVLNVLPRDERKLRSVCERLSEQLGNSRSVSDAQTAALALSFVNDPVAVPFLANALMSAKNVEAQATAGLERIGDASAVQALAAAIPSTPGANDPNTAAGARALLIRSALENLRARTTDPAVQLQIQEALRTFSSPQTE